MIACDTRSAELAGTGCVWSWDLPGRIPLIKSSPRAMISTQIQIRFSIPLPHPDWHCQI